MVYKTRLDNSAYRLCARTFNNLRGPATINPEAAAYWRACHLTGPGRSKLFGNSADEYFKVHHLGRSEADVTEGSGGIWEHLHYD